MTHKKILIVDDHVIVREGLKSLLELEEDFQVIGEAASSIECLKQMEILQPDIVLMDLKMPGVSGIEAVRIIKQKYQEVKVILLTNYDDQEYVIEALKIGMDAYVLKDVKKGDLVRIIHMVDQGQVYIDPVVAPKITQFQAQTFREPIPRKGLSPRELQILELVVAGKSNQRIADQIHVSLDTVKSHLKNIYGKLGVHSRSQAIKTSLQKGLVQIPGS
jgi:DNA-binding NarL/FixJ family response regulator